MQHCVPSAVWDRPDAAAGQSFWEADGPGCEAHGGSAIQFVASRWSVLRSGVPYTVRI